MIYLFAVSGIVIASFLAFQDVYDALQAETANRAKAEGERDEARRQFAALSPSEQQKMIERLQSSNEQLAQYLKDTQSQLGELKRQIAATAEPWKLTSDQKRELAKILDEEVDRFPIAVKCLIASTQSQTYTQDLTEFLMAHGWRAQPNCFNGLRPDIAGLYLALPRNAEDFGAMPANAPRLFSIFSRAGIKLKVGTDDSLNMGETAVVIGNAPGHL